MPMSEIESILEKYRPGINSAEVYNCASVFSFLAEKLNGMISTRINSPPGGDQISFGG